MGKNELKLLVSAALPVKCATREEIFGWLRDAAEIAAKIAQRNEPGAAADEFLQLRTALDSAAWREFFEIREGQDNFTIAAKKYPAGAVLLGLSILWETITDEVKK